MKWIGSGRPSKSWSWIILLMIFLLLAEIFEDFFEQAIPLQGTTGPSWLLRWDEWLFLQLNIELSIPILNPFMRLLTHAGSTLFWFGVAGVLWYRRRGEASLLFLALVVDSALNLGLKVAFHRLRPYQVIGEVHVLDRGGGYSFPSGHSEASFLSATILGGKFHRARPLLYTLATILAYSRVYIGAHWPSDVLLGAAIGTVVGGLILSVERRVPSPPYMRKRVE